MKSSQWTSGIDSGPGLSLKTNIQKLGRGGGQEIKGLTMEILNPWQHTLQGEVGGKKGGGHEYVVLEE